MHSPCHSRKPTRLTIAAVCMAAAAVATSTRAGSGPPALEPPDPTTLTEARALVEAMKESTRGPYSRLRWYCDDGTVLPPTPHACVEHGGGRQHAEYSAGRQRLAALGWPAGTILAATPWEELWDGERRNRRLRDLLVERYLTEVDDGWVLRRARSYRGRVQVEDEEQAGRQLLVRLMSRPEWVAENLLLAREAVRWLPHHGGSDRTRTVRRLSPEIAELDSSFEPLRISIHTTPGPRDAARVRDWAERARERGASADLLATAADLSVRLDALYGPSRQWLPEARTRLVRNPFRSTLEPLLADLEALPPSARVDRLARLMVAIRATVTSSSDGNATLPLMDLSVDAQAELERTAFSLLEQGPLTRAELLLLSRSLVEGAFACGLLSPGEREALVAPLKALSSAEEAPTPAYLESVRGLRRASGWALATTRFTFAESLARYGALEPKAFRLTDEILRSSPMLPLSRALSVLGEDVDAAAGLVHLVLGRSWAGMVGLNPGLAVGTLRLVSREELDRGTELGRDEIVLLPRTVSDLQPVAGILSLAEGNLLSHVQLLARNLGIPNATVSVHAAEHLATAAGRRVVMVVGTDGSVLVEDLASLPPEALAILDAGTARPGIGAAPLDAPAPDLAIRRPIPLAELKAGMAGSVVGPKAANLGELARLFPGRVEQAIALPFGVFFDHVSAGPDSPKTRLDLAFARFRAGELDRAGLDAEVATVRQQVTALTLTPPLEADLAAMMADLFGVPGSYGVFVRSDTNVEDLPGFTGAGLNETIPNVVDPQGQRAAIARVWASPFSERAMSWRAPLLSRPEEVYTSVLLMKSVPSDKSGVMVTTDLVARAPGLTVATSWGVGGAVDGDAAETVLLRPDGTTLLVGEAKAPYRRRLRPSGGVEWVPASAGPVLTAVEQLELRRLADDVGQRLEPATTAGGRPLPWDIEFGFVGGRLHLFQIRPLVERGTQRADRILEVVVPTGGPTSGARVRLSEPVVPIDNVQEPS